MILADAIFVIIALMTTAGALATVLARSIVYAMLGLVITMFGIAGLYMVYHSTYEATSLNGVHFKNFIHRVLTRKPS